MVSNSLYQRKGEEGITSGTHASAHSQISDYSMLHERNYEVIDVGGDSDKQDYHHLQRPSPPTLPNGRGTNFNFTPPKEFNSMSTLTSQLGGTPGSREMFQYGKLMNPGTTGGTFPTKSSSIGPDGHMYRELEHTDAGGRGPQVKDIYRSPTESDSPENAQFFSHRGTMSTLPSDSVQFGFHNEGLYSPNFESSLSSRVQPGGLENVPETGTMFSEPQNPTAFPVHQYERISGENGGPQYETPVSSRAKAMTSSSSSAMPINSQAAAGSRPRMNSGARYETEVAQMQQTEESPYSKLKRLPGAQPITIAVQMYSELRSQESEGNVCMDKPVFPHSHSSVELQRQQDSSSRNLGNAHANKGFTIPAHMGVAAGGVADISGISSPTDSLSSYATRLQERSATESAPITDEHIEGLLFNEQGSGNPQSALVEVQHQHKPCRRKPSLDMPPRGGGMSSLRHDQRAWSEEPAAVQPFTSGRLVMSDRSGFSSSTALTSYGRHDNVPAPPTACRDVRVNGMDMRLGEYTRSKTMV